MKILQSTNQYGIRADDDFFTNITDLQMPMQESNKIATLNNQGFMRVELDKHSLSWVKLSSQTIQPCLELGSAYGQASIECLKQGGTVIANDISPEHLVILRSRVDSKLHHKLYLNNSSFPDELILPHNSISNILFCRLGHFFDDQTLIKSFKKAYQYLLPEGKLFFVAVSPHHYTLREKFLPLFKKRKQNKEENIGCIENMRDYIPRSKDKIPKFMNCFDEDTIQQLIRETEFLIVENSLFDYGTNNSDGRGFIGVEMIKKG